MRSQGTVRLPWDYKMGKTRGTSIFQTWDWWDVPWDPKAPWDNETSKDILRQSQTILSYVTIVHFYCMFCNIVLLLLYKELKTFFLK